LSRVSFIHAISPDLTTNVVVLSVRFMQGAGGLLPGTYQLVLQFPRKVLQAAMDQTLADAGLETTSQQAVLLEPVS
jgi:hypothetical protein